MFKISFIFINKKTHYTEKYIIMWIISLHSSEIRRKIIDFQLNKSYYLKK